MFQSKKALVHRPGKNSRVFHLTAHTALKASAAAFSKQHGLSIAEVYGLMQQHGTDDATLRAAVDKRRLTE